MKMFSVPVTGGLKVNARFSVRFVPDDDTEEAGRLTVH
jgi:hypothetical protein